MRTLVLLFALVRLSPAFAQHLHLQTAYAPDTGWSLFWYDFDAGPFPADAFTQPVAAPARTTIPSDPQLTNALGKAGSPVWILPQVEQPGLPSVGFGTQGTGSFQNSQVRLRLATFAGPGNFAVYNTDPFGGSDVLISVRDGISDAGAVVQGFPAGHAHVNWAFARPGLYELGFRAEGITTGGESLQSDVVTFRFRVLEPRRPLLTLRRSGDSIELTVDAEAGLPLVVEGSSDLHNWETLLSTESSQTGSNFGMESDRPFRFYRARHPF